MHVEQSLVLIYSIIMNRGNNGMRYFFIILTWVVSLFSCLDLSVVTADSSKEDILLSSLVFGVMIILIVIQIFYVVKRKDNILGTVLSSIMPLLHFFFLLFRNHINFGYGDTLGILGHYKPLGILSLFNVSRDTAFVCFCLNFLMIAAVFIFKYCLTLKKTNCLAAKAIIITVAAAAVVVTFYEIGEYFKNNRFRGLLLLSVILLWVLHFLIIFITNYFVSWWKGYLTGEKLPKELRDSINNLFKGVDTFERTYYKVCIMKTKEEAKQFILSEEYKNIKKGIYNLLKTHDKYDLLEEDDICVFVDYKEHMESLKDYVMWLYDMSNEEKIEYDNELINS